MLLVGSQAGIEAFQERLEKAMSKADHNPHYAKKNVPYGNNIISVITHHGDTRRPKNQVEYGAYVNEAPLKALAKRLVRKLPKFWGPKFIFYKTDGAEHLFMHSSLYDGLRAWFYGKNLVTDAGDIFFAQAGVGEATTNAFGQGQLGNGAAPTPAKDSDYSDLAGKIAGSLKNHASTYPKSNDSDTDNTGRGADVSTWLQSYTTSDFNATGINQGCIVNASPGASEPILTLYTQNAFTKASTDTLKQFENETSNGV